MNKTNLLIALSVFFSCGSQKTKYSESIIDPAKSTLIELINTNPNDTIVNGGEYETFVFLSDSILYSIAKKNGISEYLRIYYDLNTNPHKYSNTWDKQKALIANDTAKIRFDVFIPELKKDSIVSFYWQFEAFVNFLKNDENFDAAYA